MNLEEIEARWAKWINPESAPKTLGGDFLILLAEVKRLRCCGNCEHFETVCGEGKCFVECEKPAWRFDKKVRYTDGSGKCEKWEALK